MKDIRNRVLGSGGFVDLKVQQEKDRTVVEVYEERIAGLEKRIKDLSDLKLENENLKLENRRLKSDLESARSSFLKKGLMLLKS